MPRRYPGNPIIALRAKMAAAAQAVYDEWEQDDEGESFEYGCGGICDDIASAMAGVLREAGFEVTTQHDDSENHTAVYVLVEDSVYYVDIPHSIYETGTFYRYRKISDVTFSAGDVVIDVVDNVKWEEISED